MPIHGLIGTFDHLFLASFSLEPFSESTAGQLKMQKM